MKNSNRLVFILKYLLEHTDEDHYATISDINEFLRTQQLGFTLTVIRFSQSP